MSIFFSSPLFKTKGKLRTTLLGGALSGLLLLGFGQAAPAPEWEKTLGALSPLSSNTAGELTFVGEKAIFHTDANGKILWQHPVGDMGRAMPVSSPDGRIYAASYDDYLYSFDKGGKLLWKLKLDGDIFASPALRLDGSVIAATAGGTIYAIDPNGTVLWSFKATTPLFSSPAVTTEGDIYIGSQGGLLYALDKTGVLKWTFAARSTIFSSPALDEDGNIYFGSSDRHLYSLAPDGSERWKYKTGLFINASPIITDEGLIVVGSYDKTLYAFDKMGGVQWTFKTQGAIAASATQLDDGSLLIGDLSGQLYALDRMGKPIWTISLGKKIDTPVTSSAGRAYIVAEGGTVYALNKMSPLAAGAWPTFRAHPSGRGRQATVAELGARIDRNRQPRPATTATTQPSGQSIPQPMPSQPVQPMPSTPATLVAPKPASITPEQYLADLTRGVTLKDGLLHVPVPPLLGLWKWPHTDFYAQTALPLNTQTVPLATLLNSPSIRAEATADGLKLSYSGSDQAVILPLSQLKWTPPASAFERIPLTLGKELR